MNYFVIKMHDWYINEWPKPSLVREIENATRYAHPDLAKQVILNHKLDGGKVYQINYTELEVK